MHSLADAGAGRAKRLDALPVATRVKAFRQQLLESAERAGSWLCVGLDPDPEHYPDGMGEEDTLEFCIGVVESVVDVACAVKPNAAFFEALGLEGHAALESLIEHMPPELPVILDGKRSDIGNTAQKYAQAAFDVLGVDAVTLNPYMGRDSVAPFAEYEEKGVFLLARTSNASARDFQDLRVGNHALFETVARKAMEWDRDWGTLGLVAGATAPDELADLRAVCGDGVPFLIPGVGAQGGDARVSLARGGDSQGRYALVNVGRSILNAGSGPDWRSAVAKAAADFAKQVPFK
jgi:orotidine-5'-phosphate decarboxylase